MNHTASDAPVTTTVSALSDRRLLQQLKRLTAVEHQIEIVVIDHLRELERRRLYLPLGCSSLFDYATRELGYSEAAAWRRIKAMRLCREVEGARERMRDGSLTLNSAALLQKGLEQLKGLLSHVDPHLTLGQLVERVVREAVERHDPARPPRGRRTGSRADGVAAETSAPKDAAGIGAAAAPGSAAPAGAATSPAKAADCEHRSATAAKPPGATTQPSAPKAGGGRGRQRQAAPPPSQVRGRAIPAAVKRQVWERDRGCCSYVDRCSGRRCGSRHLLQIDHVLPFALGGSAEPDNLRLLCAAHHRHRHAL